MSCVSKHYVLLASSEAVLCSMDAVGNFNLSNSAFNASCTAIHITDYVNVNRFSKHVRLGDKSARQCPY